MLTNSWCMGICRRLCSHQECRVNKHCRETAVHFIAHYISVFDLCLSNALLLPVVILVLTAEYLDQVSFSAADPVKLLTFVSSFLTAQRQRDEIILHRTSPLFFSSHSSQCIKTHIILAPWTSDANLYLKCTMPRTSDGMLLPLKHTHSFPLYIQVCL